MPDHTVDAANAALQPRGDYGNVLEQIIKAGHCPFCSENLPEIHPHPIIRETAHWIVTTNAWPYAGARFHFLLISTTHVERIEDLSLDARLGFFQEYDQLAREYCFAGATILWRSGTTDITGASVKHLHAQIVVGYPRDQDSEVITGLLGFRPQKDPSS